MTGEAKKRACSLMACVGGILSCEEDVVNNEFVVMQQSCTGMTLCCVEQGCSAKLSCCPQPIVCFGGQGQVCCLYGRSALPCKDTTPMELGCCGVMCIDHKDQIMKAEAAIRQQRVTAAQANTIEATIVSMGGAPPQEMDR
jgi:hypothetical protein